MRLTVCQIWGLPGLPVTKAGSIKWLKAAEVSLYRVDQSWTFSLLALPEAVQTAYELRLAESAGITLSERYDESWRDLEAKPVGVQSMTRDRAASLFFVSKHRAASLKWAQIEPHLAEEGLDKCPGERTVKR